MTRRKHGVEFKRHVVEEILSGASSFASVCGRHDLAPSLVERWREKYKAGRLMDERRSLSESAQEVRIAELERMVGRPTTENDLLKKAASYVAEQRRRVSLPNRRSPLSYFRL